MQIFPNQIVFTNDVSINFSNSNHSYFFDFSVFIHKDHSNQLIINNNYLFYGECFHDMYPERNNEQLLELLNSFEFNEKLNFISRLSGYFFFCFKENNNFYFLNDCAGQFEIYYFNEKEKIIVASQPNLILPFLSPDRQITNAPEYIIKNKINIFGKTPYKYIHKIIPNHIVNMKENKQQRFYPEKDNINSDINLIAKEVVKILQNSMYAYSIRKPLVLALTAGWDSRILFASCLKILDKVTLFILNHNTKTANIDKKIAKQIALHYNKDLEIINYNLKKDINKIFVKAVWKDEEKTHLIAINNQHLFPDHYFINGNISEVARNFYDPLPKKLTTEDICFIIGIKADEYEMNAVNHWLSDFKSANDKGFHLLDFIYWENKMSNWAGSAKSIANLYNSVISPLNNRYLLNLLLSTHRDKYRDKSFHLLYKKILKTIDPVLTSFKINPTRKNYFIKFLKKCRIYPFYRNIFFRLRKLKF